MKFKRFLSLLMAVLMVFIMLGTACLASTAPSDDSTTVVGEEASNEADENKESSDSIKLGFEPSNFVRNLGIMGKGMLGIFIVIGIIILAVYALGFIGSKGKKN